jgi:hypothetical protein
MRKIGRPKTEINLEELQKLCALGCSDDEIAAWFGVNRKTISRRKKHKAFSDAMELGKAHGRISVRRLLFKIASEDRHGSVAAAIFLAKNMIGYRDVPLAEKPPEQQGPNTSPDVMRQIRGIYGIPEPVDTNVSGKADSKLFAVVDSKIGRA